MNLPYTYQRIMDAAATLNACITGVVVNDREALGPRAVKLLDVAANMSGVAAWIARDRRDAIMPEAADETIITQNKTQGEHK